MGNLERARELFFEGVSCFEGEHFDQAELKFRESLQLAPDRVSTMTNLSATLIKQNKFDEARDLCLKLISIDNGLADAWNYLGVIDQHQSGADSAIANFDKALRINPDDPTVLNNKGISLDELGQGDAALECFEKAIAHRHDYAEAYYHRGNVLKKLDRWDEALGSYARAIELKPDYADAQRGHATALARLRPPLESSDSDERAMSDAQEAYLRGDWSAAEAICRRLISSNSDNFDALNLLGIVTAQTNRPEEAAELLGRAIAIDPDDADVCSNLGNVLAELQRFDEALRRYDQAIALEPDHAEAYYGRAEVLQALERMDAALDSYNRALDIKADYANAYYGRGNVQLKLKRLDDAKLSFERAISFEPDSHRAWNNHGVVLHELGRHGEALESYDRALRIRPDYGVVSFNRGNALRALQRPGDALESYERALQTLPEFAEAHSGRGGALRELRRWNEALQSFDQAIRLKPDYADAHFSRAFTLHELKQWEAALDSYDRALKFRPDYAEAYYGRGDSLQAMKRWDEALESYDRALRIKPDQEFLYGDWLHYKMKLCDWRNVESHTAEIVKRLERGEASIGPFGILPLVDSLAVHRKAAEIWLDNKYPARHALGSLPRRNKHERIRIGYFSADYHDHPITYLMAELFERHDKNRFELFAFSFDVNRNDGMRRRLTAAFDQFLDVRTMSDREVALLSRKMEIDIAVDLNGITYECRPEIFFYRAAPVQVHYIGYPGTLGLGFVDYLVADRTLIPDHCRQHYAEKIIYLPNSYQVNDRKRQISDRRFSRAELNLPETGFVFCCFNNNYKITPDIFDIWARILKQVKGSVLWLVEGNPTVTVNLRREAQDRGLSADRLVFARHVPLPEHLARHRAADLFLDTLPYNAHTTASDALWTGLPVLTRVGEAFAGRVAASLLCAIDVPELITTTAEEYEALAVELATNPKRLDEIRAKLARNRLTTPLFDSELLARHIEDAYTQIHQRDQEGLPPENIHVRP